MSSTSNPQSFKPLSQDAKNNLENVIKRRSIYFPAFEIYGGSTGLYDLGPIGCLLGQRIETLWRLFYINEEELLEISCPSVTPCEVLKTSGHAQRFTDLMVLDAQTGEYFRADKLVEQITEQLLSKRKTKTLPSKLSESAESMELSSILIKHIDSYTDKELQFLRNQVSTFSKEEMAILFRNSQIRNPNCPQNVLSDPQEFNLMFASQLGPKSDATTLCYLRPECAQGIFVNFRRLYEYHHGRMPFGCAQIGPGYRNEIAPRNALLRLRQFQMAEIEYFVYPGEKSHPKFHAVKDLKVPLLCRDCQEKNFEPNRALSLQKAIQDQIIANECLGYFIGRTYLFLKAAGIQDGGIRFRQHMKNEMAHYAIDCWDAEILTSFGWIECVGHADRGSYDLSRHMQVTKTPLVAMKSLETPVIVEDICWEFNKSKLGSQFKSRAQDLMRHLTDLPNEKKNAVAQQLTSGKTFSVALDGNTTCEIDSTMMTLETKKKKTHEISLVPEVIEPSFGMSRLLYCVLEHTFCQRDGEGQQDRTYFCFPSNIAPVQCSILTLSSKSTFDPIIQYVKNQLKDNQITYLEDTSTATIGKRYSRTDEIGIPYAITIDFDSIKDDTVTIRERDSMDQIRLNTSKAMEVLANMIHGKKTWADARRTYPQFSTSSKSS